MKISAALQISDVSAEDHNIYEAVMAKIRTDQMRMAEEMAEMNRILDLDV